MPTATGGCHCGAVRYALADTSGFAFTCHCDDCRKLSGGARLAAVSAKRADLVVDGELRRYTYDGGTKPIHCHFCPSCSTQIFAEPTAHPEVATIRLGTLDDDRVVTRVKRIYGDQACAWERGG